MKVLFISGREPAYTRNAVVLQGLRENGFEVIECTASSRSYLSRYPTVMGKFLLKKDHDLIFIGFFGQPLVPVIRKLTSKPIIFDAFLSAYDTMCFDRRRFKPESLTGKFLYWLDKHSCEIADRVLLDTDAHIEYFVNSFNLENEKFQRVFVGADNSMFYPRDVQREDGTFRVFYYGTYRPLQGIECIVKAAALLKPHKDIIFTLVGKGQMHAEIMKLAQRLQVDNIEFIDWVPYELLPMEIAKADICLGGHFSNIQKANRVIAGKTFQFIAMEKPVIVGDNPANRELFENRKNALMAKMASPAAWANAILELKENKSLREDIADGGYKTFMERCTVDVIGKEIKEIAEKLVT